MFKLIVALFGSATLLSASPLAAQQLSTATAADANPAIESCELHVWPADDFHTVYYGWGHGGTVDGSLKQREGYQRVWIDPLSTARQVELLTAQPLPTLLGLPGYTMVVHPQRLPSQTIRTTPTRLAPGTPVCYAELVVDTVVLQHNVLSGKGLNVIFRYRRFDASPAPLRSLGTFIVQPVNLVLNDKEPPEPTAFAAEMERAFVATIAEFGARLQAPPKGKPKT